jgi:hypothetical protein
VRWVLPASKGVTEMKRKWGEGAGRLDGVFVSRVPSWRRGEISQISMR